MLLNKETGVFTPVNPPAECKDVRVTVGPKGLSVTDSADFSCSMNNCGANVVISGDFPHHRPLVHSDLEGLGEGGGQTDPAKLSALMKANGKYLATDPKDILGEYSYHEQTNLGPVDNSVTIFAEDYRLQSFIASFSTVSAQGNICDFSARMTWNQHTNVLTPVHASPECEKLSIHLGPHGAEVVDPDGKCSQPNCGMGAYLSGKFPKHSPLSQKMIDGFKQDPANAQFSDLKEFADANKYFIPKAPAPKPQSHPAHPAPPKGKKAPPTASAHSGLEASEEPQYGEHRRAPRAAKVHVGVNVEM